MSSPRECLINSLCGEYGGSYIYQTFSRDNNTKVSLHLQNKYPQEKFININDAIKSVILLPFRPGHSQDLLGILKSIKEVNL